MNFFAFGFPAGSQIALQLGVAIGTLLLTAVFVQILWNWTLPQVLRLPTISYWQSFRLLILCTLLFGGLARFTFDCSEHIIPNIYIGQPPYDLKNLPK